MAPVAAATRTMTASSAAWRNKILKADGPYVFVCSHVHMWRAHVSAPDCQHRRVGLGRMSTRLK